MKAKKVLAMLMASAMIMGTTVTAFAAAPEGNITIELPTSAQDATLYYEQIITEDRTSPIGWKFVDDTIEKNFVNAWINRDAETNVTEDDADNVIKALFNIVEENDEGVETLNQNAIAGEIHESQELSRALAAVNANDSVTNRTIDPNEMGLYMITATKAGYTFNPMAVYVGPDFEGVQVTAKGSEDQIKKESDADSHTVASGDTVEYTVTAEYPYYPANATNKVFTISDTVENATFVTTPITVTINGQLAQEGIDYETPTFTDNNTKMTIDFKYNLAKAGDEVKVKYSVTVGDINSDANVIVKNSAKAETDGKYTIAEVVSDSATFTIEKKDSQTNEMLSGAEFTLYVADENGDETITYKESGQEQGTQIKVNIVEVKTTLVADDPTTNFVEKNGEVTFFGLDPDKTYYVEETKAPEGYSRLTEIWKLEGASEQTTGPVVSDTGTDDNDIPYTVMTTTTTVTDYTTMSIPNTKLSSLPSTGGIGTTIFTIGGCVIMVTAAGLYFATRKKEQN